MEVMMDPGNYSLIVFADIEDENKSRDYVLNVFYSPNMKMYAMEDNSLGGKRYYSDMLSNIAINKGDREMLTKEGEV